VWLDLDTELAAIARRALFFIGGAPRSGTTWVQRIADAHPQVSCRGEGFFQKHVAGPLDALYGTYRQSLTAKNETVFRGLEGYPLPAPEDVDVVLGTAILLALRRQGIRADHMAVGEKTPENVFFFPRLKRMFPAAKFIGVARDPRDVIVSAWHAFAAGTVGAHGGKADFVEHALPQIDLGLRAMVELRRMFGDDCLLVTYERLIDSPHSVVAEMFRFIGVSDAPDLVARCVADTQFEAFTGGRQPGDIREGSFFRRGISGGWRSDLAPELGELAARNLAWAYAYFGWPL
jgi:hypothetical protein